mgnify:CR=1 FL=1
MNLFHTDYLTCACTEEVEMNRGDNADLKGDNDSRFVASEEAENKHDSSDAIVGETDFTVGKSPAHNDGAGTLGNQRTTGVSGLGEGTPKVILFSYPVVQL